MSLVGCSPWGRSESDTTERLHFHFSLPCTGEGNGNPLQCSCLENPRDRGAWWATVYGVAQSQTQLKRLSRSSSKHSVNTYIFRVYFVIDCYMFWQCTNQQRQSSALRSQHFDKLRQHMVICGKSEYCQSFSHLGLFATPCAVAHQAPLFVEFSRQEYWSGQPLTSPGDLSDLEIEPRSPAMQEDSLMSEPPQRPKVCSMH